MDSDITINVEKYLTPYKYDKPVLTGSGIEGTFDEKAVDIPFVFYHNNKFYMMYVGFDGIGYQTALATSDNLLDWEHKGVILARNDKGRWDSGSIAGTWIIKESDNLYDLPKLKKIDGKYWMIYHAYPLAGYEQGRAEIGLAWTEDEELLDWHRLEEPIFSWKDGGEWEAGGLYKACVIQHDGLYYMFYNAKTDAYSGKPWIEQTGLATSKDLLHWEKCDKNPILKVTEGAWDSVFLSDPYIVRDGDIWLNFYYGYDKKHAQDGLAYSRDLVNWIKYPEPIVKSGEPGELDAMHAHKPSILYYNDTLYHFYCGVRKWKEGDIARNIGKEFRTICVAASKPFGK